MNRSEPNFLYDRWATVARTYVNDLALVDVSSGRHWTFGELFREGESGKRIEGPIAFPHGHEPDFIFSIIRAWRSGVVTCPLEKGQQEISLATLPPGCAHLKLTSATSGTTKCVAMTGPQLAADAANIVSTMRL